MSPQSVKNASHVTTICSYVDLYRPEYALLENVVSMADTRKGLEDQNVLSQLVAFFVSLGYQVNQYIMDAWTYGSCQQRSIVILTIAAPGLNSIQQPLHTHSLPIDDTAGRSLGILPNGQRFGGREHYPTPFSHVFASTATSDLPNIGNGNVQTCISHPNHRVSAQPSRKDRALLELIPRSPPGFGYREAYKMGCIPAYLEKPGKEFGRAYQRIKGSHLVPTITTGLNIQDSRNGATIHWQQDRPITTLEARRTQGYLDHEPIIGSLSAQYRIVGNGVDRQVAFALGQAIRQAVIANRQHEAGPEARAPTLVDVEDDEDHFSDSASTRSGLDACVPPSRNGAATFINASLMLAKQSQEKASSTDGDQGDETAVTEMSGLDGASDIQDSPPTAPHSSTTSILSRMSMTIAHGIKELAHRSRRSLPISTTAPSSKPSKRSYDEFSDRSSDLSVYPLDRPMGARKQIRLADRAQP
jgi:DNA (cytosine-5)-methyltransferase 1